MFHSIQDVARDIQQGKMFILLDGEHRENEGDLVIPASHISPEEINFMLKYCRGQICLTIDESIAKRLGLNLQKRTNVSDLDAALTTSIDARHGLKSGISAVDRAHTINVAIDPNSTTDDIKTPGHIFPIIAKSEGVLDRPGHTEASVDLMRLFGITPAAVICEILNDDGSVAQKDDLVRFAERHNIKLFTIEQLVQYRKA